MVAAHRDVDRDGASPLPYGTHPVDVACKLRYLGGITDEALLIASLLHDVVEETDVTLESLEREFGERVANLVGELTREEPTPEQMRALDDQALWEFRSGLLMEGIRRMSPEAQAIKLADRLSNLEGAMATRGPKKLARYFAQTQAILEIIPKSANEPLWKEVRRRVEKTR